MPSVKIVSPPKVSSNLTPTIQLTTCEDQEELLGEEDFHDANGHKECYQQNECFSDLGSALTAHIDQHYTRHPLPAQQGRLCDVRKLLRIRSKRHSDHSKHMKWLYCQDEMKESRIVYRIELMSPPKVSY
jgi:hypothetical protein